jgi:ribonuclease HII
MDFPLLDHPHNSYERSLAQQGYRAIVGLDEVGRGAWAGPLVAAAVIMPLRPRLYGVRDSKMLTEKRRTKLAKQIKDRAINWAIGQVSNDEIDRFGIAQANAMAMQRAVAALTVAPEFILIDAFKVVGLPAKYKAIAHGDAMVYSIAAASIVAKVARDEMMVLYHEQFPQYGFAEHKGYGTDGHTQALQRHGICMLHRRSFQPMKSLV